MTLLAVSPHLDDVPFSIGATLAAHPDAIVATVLAGDPPIGMLTAYDASCGFNSSAEAMAERRAENARACAVLDVGHIEGMFLDNQYGVTLDEHAVTSWLETVVLGRGVTEIAGPLGLGHPDHRAVSRATREAAKATGLPCYLYEELPYRVNEPGETVATLEPLNGRLVAFETGPRHVKAAAVECFRSQVNDAARASLYVPERIWLLP